MQKFRRMVSLALLALSLAAPTRAAEPAVADLIRQRLGNDEPDVASADLKNGECRAGLPGSLSRTG